MSPENPQDKVAYVRKVCLVGDPAVGKTSLVRRFVIDKYDDSYIQTIGAKVIKKTVRLDDGGQVRDVTLMIWDVMGQKHFRIIESVAFQHIAGAMVVCDVTRRSTLENVGYWLDALRSVSGRVPAIIMANKSDLLASAEFGEDDVARVAAEAGAEHFVTSAKTGENVESAFASLARQSLEATGQ
jgi:small GTP-binding protein